VSAQELLTDKDLNVYIGLHTPTHEEHRLPEEQHAWVTKPDREPTFMWEDDDGCVHPYTRRTQLEFMQSVVIYKDDNYVSPRNAYSWWNFP
jgi:hypothetical protein